jgi:hypothetical protein
MEGALTWGIHSSTVPQLAAPVDPGRRAILMALGRAGR